VSSSSSGDGGGGGAEAEGGVKEKALRSAHFARFA